MKKFFFLNIWTFETGCIYKSLLYKIIERKKQTGNNFTFYDQVNLSTKLYHIVHLNHRQFFIAIRTATLFVVLWFSLSVLILLNRGVLLYSDEELLSFSLPSSFYIALAVETTSPTRARRVTPI